MNETKILKLNVGEVGLLHNVCLKAIKETDGFLQEKFIDIHKKIKELT